MTRLAELWRTQGLAVAAVVFAVVAGWLIHASSDRQADAIYRSTIAVCDRSNVVREELDQLYSAFETHNSITGDLFSIVGEALVGNNPRAARAFSRFSIQYRAIASEYDDIEPTDCKREIEKP